MCVSESSYGNDNTLWASLHAGILNASRGYTMYPLTDFPMEMHEPRVREQWSIFILAAKHIEPDHPAQDRLTRTILWARELGVLSKEEEGHAQDAITADGRIWIDLPFFALDVQEAWKDMMSPSKSSVERCNLNAAIARLASLGVLNDTFSGCGLAIMSLALETSNDPVESIETALRLLPLVNIWIKYAGEKLLRLSMANRLINNSAWYANGGETIGGLARNAQIETTMGFSRDRFLFWKDRLSEIKWSDNKDVEDLACACSMQINTIWDSYFGLELFVHTY